MMMQKIKIGAVTIGQSPRTDITEDAGRFFGDRVELLEFGALDRYTLEEAKQLQPIPGDYGLTSRLMARRCIFQEGRSWRRCSAAFTFWRSAA